MTVAKENPYSSSILLPPQNQVQLTSLLEFPGLVVVDFFATWCGPCMDMAPKFAKLSSDFLNVKFAKVDVDDEEELASKYAINAIPTFMFFRGGNEIHRIEGANEEDLRSQISMRQ